MTIVIRHIRIEDAKQMLNLCKEVDHSGFMLFDPGERTTTVNEQEKRIEEIIVDDRSTVLVAEEIIV